MRRIPAVLYRLDAGCYSTDRAAFRGKDGSGPGFLPGAAAVYIFGQRAIKKSGFSLLVPAHAQAEMSGQSRCGVPVSL